MAENREAYSQKMEAFMQDFGPKLEALRMKAEESEGDMRVQYMNQVHKLNTRRDTLQEKLTELRKSDEENWDRLSKDIDSMVDDINEDYRQSLSHFK